MIDFTIDGQAIVWFDIVGAKAPARTRIEVPLSDWLVFSKSGRTMEELRVLVFAHAKRNARAQSAA